MRPYGWKRLEWRDEDHAPCTKYVGHGIRSTQRKQRRRKLHQRARRAATLEIASEIDSELKQDKLEEQCSLFEEWYRSENEDEWLENSEQYWKDRIRFLVDVHGFTYRSH